MKKIMIFGFLSIFAAMTIISCGSGSGNDGENDEADSLALAWANDSLEMVKRTTADLTVFEAHGPVKQIVINKKFGDGNWIKFETEEFDQDGRFVKLDGRDPFTYSGNPEEAVYVRDKDGRISEAEFYENHLSYIWKDNQLVGYKWAAEGSEGKDTYDYDENGFISKVNHTEFDPGTEDVVDSQTTKYSYSDKDEYGNWTIRKESDCETKREITYYPIERNNP